MRFKYYLRGIGIGVTLATLLLTISFYFGRDALTKEKLTDEEIIQKATALGMVMPEGEETTEQIEEESVPEAGPEDETAESEAIEDTEAIETGEDVVEQKAEEKYTLDQAIEDAKAEKENSSDTVTYVAFSIKGGESSEMISKNLYKKGLVDSAEDFNKYLAKLKVDDIISTGSFYIPQGSSYDDIVALLVNKEVRTTSPPKAPEAPKAPDKPATPKAGE